MAGVDPNSGIAQTPSARRPPRRPHCQTKTAPRQIQRRPAPRVHRRDRCGRRLRFDRPRDLQTAPTRLAYIAPRRLRMGTLGAFLADDLVPPVLPRAHNPSRPRRLEQFPIDDHGLRHHRLRRAKTRTLGQRGDSMSENKKVLLEKVREFEARTGHNVDSYPDDPENTASVLKERRHLSEPLTPEEAKRQMFVRSRR